MSRVGQAVRVVIGLSLGLVLTEAAFSWRADRAFPHINVLQSDPELAVRLIPGETQRVKVADNPTSTLTINASGWRGEDVTEPGSIVVIGDSQVFGLGVDDDETTPAQLAALTGTPPDGRGDVFRAPWMNAAAVLVASVALAGLLAAVGQGTNPTDES